MAHRPSIASLRALRKLGEDINKARRRRRLTMAMLAEQVSTTRQTLQKIEAGKPNVDIGTYADVLDALGLLDGLGELAAPGKDQLGLALSDEGLPKRVRFPSRPRRPAT